MSQKNFRDMSFLLGIFVFVPLKSPLTRKMLLTGVLTQRFWLCLPDAYLTTVVFSMIRLSA
jgi:hypothetical protein